MDIAIIGEGGYSKKIQEVIFGNVNYKIVGFLEDHYVYIAYKDNQFFGPITIAEKINKFYSDLKFFIAIENNAIRKSIVQKIGLMSNHYVTLIHKTAVISTSALIGHGTVIMPNVVVNANTKIGKHCIINTGAVIEHDNVIEDYVNISSNATLTGMVKIGEGCHIGAGTTIFPNSKIADWSVIDPERLSLTQLHQR